jgi:aminoglycoside 3-N-acetyltransferase
MNKKLFIFNDEVWTIKKVIKVLREHITPGEILCMEVDTMRFGKLCPDVNRNQFLSNFFELFKELAGPEGVIIIPSFSYSWGDDSSDKVFDIINTPSKVGIFSEFMREQSNVERTLDPMFSYLIFGNNSANIAKVAGKNTFGPDGIYQYLYENNAKLISFGLNKYDPTFIHYAEQYYHQNIHKLDYRYIKEFNGEIINFSGDTFQDKQYCFSRILERYGDWDFYDKNLISALKKEKLLQDIIIGGGIVRVSDAESVFNASLKGLSEDKHFYIHKDGVQSCTSTI